MIVSIALALPIGRCPPTRGHTPSLASRPAAGGTLRTLALPSFSRQRQPRIEQVRFALDSPLEQAGFEPSVSRSTERTSAAASDLQEETRRHRINQDE